MARKANPERPRRFNVSLLLYPSRHQAIIAYLQADRELSYAAKVIIAITAALTGGVLQNAAEIAAEEEEAMFTDIEALFQ